MTMANNLNLQDDFLNKVRKEHILITVFLVSGYQIKGYVKGFDNFTVIIDVEGKQNMIYKHAISTIIPSKNVKFNLGLDNLNSNNTDSL
jgi:host factor-I protein